jgi:transposase
MNRNRVTPRILGIDEVMIGGEYRAVMTNLEMKTIYDVQEKRTLASLTKFFQAIPDRDSIEWIAADMWGPYKSLFKTQAPQAKFVIDKFHVVRMASEALEQIRKSLQRTLTQEEALLIKKNIRWSLLKGKNQRNDADWEIIEHIRQYHPRLAVAFDLKESFYAIYDNDTRQDAEIAFKDWEQSIPLEYKKEFGGVAKTVNNHHQDIFNYFDCPITNAYTEAFNGLLQVVNRMGRGYSYEVLRAKLMFSKVAMQSGQIVGTREIPKDKSLLEHSTSAAIKPSDYGAHIPTLNAISEREDLD